MTRESPLPTTVGLEGVLASLYRRAFAEYGARALWNKRGLEAPTAADALVVARAPCAWRATVKPGGGGTDRAGLPCRSLVFRPIQTMHWSSPDQC